MKITGKDRVAFMETLICADVAGLKDGEASLTVFTNEKGGIIDDAIIANAGSYLVSCLLTRAYPHLALTNAHATAPCGQRSMQRQGSCSH